jgi:2'-5' RNA ligase
MGCNLNGVGADVPPEDRLNVFALVVYIPDPLGAFLDHLRRELVPLYNPHAHVSVLPPRTISGDWQEASRQARTLTESWEPFEVELTAVDIFPFTEVIYIEVGGGACELRQMHTAMNRDALLFDEPYPYHPHITLAQEVPHEAVPELFDLAKRRWSEFSAPRTFRVERASFVQNTPPGCWIDLAEYSLGAVARVRR